ncbi:MAG: universal stress protein [Bacteroidota bacterium]
MKNNIVVGTDFSENSINALKHATSIADKAKCDITLLWVETPGTTLGLMAENITDYRIIAEKRLTEIAIDHKNLMPQGNKIITKIRQGRPYIELAKEAKECDAVMVVVGSHGVSGYDESFIGNTAFRTVMSAKCPVLTIQHFVNITRALTDIVLLVDSTINTLQKVPFAIKIARLFSAKIHILGLYTSSALSVQHLVDANVGIAEKVIREANVRYSTTVRESFNMANTTIKFTKDIDANLIVIMSEQDDDFGVWLGNSSREMINKSTIPVLCIHPNDKAYDLSR